MASDPYGFPDSAPGGTDSSAPSFAIWTGMGAALCAAMGPCSCYMSYFMAVPLSLAAIWYGWQGYRSSVPIERTASVAGLLGGLISLVPSMIIIMVVVMYIGIFAVALLGAALDQ